ncbi:MAG: DNA-binding domain-containing protein [Sphingobium sp.]|nr:DNA-binding domain-containing protein [Sphingobium sp.]
MGLRALQEDFRAWLVSEDEGSVQRLPLGDRRGLPVYQNNYRGQLLGCLEESYPQTQAWIGSEAFRAIAARHIDACRRCVWTAQGTNMRKGFSRQRRWRQSFPDDPEVVELAALELALGEAFIAEDAEPLTQEDLRSFDWDHAEIRLVPSAAFLSFHTNAEDIWCALDSEGACPQPVMTAQADTIVVWRQDFVCCFQRLEADEAALLPALSIGLSFAVMCERLVGQLGVSEGIERAGALLARWTQAGLLRRPGRDA